MASEIQNIGANPSAMAAAAVKDVARAPTATAKPEIKAIEKPPVVAVDQMETVKAAAAEIEKYLRSSGRELAIAFDESVSRPVVKVINPGTSEVVRQIPNEEVLQVARWIRDTVIDPARESAIKGMLLRGSA